MTRQTRSEICSPVRWLVLSRASITVWAACGKLIQAWAGWAVALQCVGASVDLLPFGVSDYAGGLGLGLTTGTVVLNTNIQCF